MNYQKIYNSIINRAKEQEFVRSSSNEYYEKHHIVPKCLGGTDISSNLAILTPEEHFLSHVLLTKIYPGNYYLLLAVQIMTGNGKYRKHNKDYGRIRRNISIQRKKSPMPVEIREKISKTKSGVKFSEKHKSNLSRAKIGKTWEELFGVERASEIRAERSQPRGPLSESTRMSISQSKKGKQPHQWAKESRIKVSKSLSGKKKSTTDKLKKYNSITKICPHCGKSGSGPSMQRWHFINCKNHVED